MGGGEWESYVSKDEREEESPLATFLHGDRNRVVRDVPAPVLSMIRRTSAYDRVRDAIVGKDTNFGTDASMCQVLCDHVL